MKTRYTDTPITAGEMTIIPLKETDIYYVNNKDSLSFYVSNQPIGIVIDSPQGKWAIDINGEQVPLDNYIREIPSLAEVLDNL